MSNQANKYFIDQYTKTAKRRGLRSRSWFKLQEIDCRDKLFRVGMTVVDLGSAPGGWSSYVKQKIGKTGSVIACDRLPMKKIYGVNFLQGDCTNPEILKKLYSYIGFQKIPVVLSDMSPSTTGISIIDVNQSMYLGYIALEVCHHILLPEGTFLVKIFQGIGFEKYLYQIKSVFNIVRLRKPQSSRVHSREIYIVAKNLKNTDV